MANNPLFPLVSPVCGKVRHWDLKTALEAKKKMEIKNRGKLHPALTVYLCSVCRAWHIGRKVV